MLSSYNNIFTNRVSSFLPWVEIILSKKGDYIWKHPSIDEIKKRKQEYNDIFEEVQELEYLSNIC